MPKLTKKQIKEARKQALEAREKAEQELLSELTDEEKSKRIESEENKKVKKDRLGLTYEDRKKIKDLDVNRQTAKVTWNINVGDLVYLPDESIGLVVKENSTNIQVNKRSHDNKKNLSKYAGRVFVITSSGNDWFYPSSLKHVN
tara:strand:+ start:446 stop:877 length:432 start_codon:yes stop_codon:yes gene_type:complete